MTGSFFGPNPQGGGLFQSQKPQLNLNLSGTGGGSGLFAPKSPAGTTGLGGLAMNPSFTGLANSPGRPGGLGTVGLGTAGLGTAGLGTVGLGTAGLGTAGLGTAGLGTAGLGTAGLGTAGFGGLGGIGGTTSLGGYGGIGGVGTGLGGTAGIGGGFGGTAGIGGGLGGTAGLGVGLGGTAGLGVGLGGTAGLGVGLGGTAGLGGLGGTAGLGGYGGIGGVGTGLGGTAGIGGGFGGTAGIGGGFGGTAGLGVGLGGTAGLGGLGGTAGLGGLGVNAGLGIGGGLSGMGRGTTTGGLGIGTGIGGGIGGGLGGQPGLGMGLGTSGGLGRGLGTAGSLFTQKPQTNVFNPSGIRQIGIGAKQQLHDEQLQLTAMSLSSPTIFGDERDTVITKLNQLQVYWGSGKGICNSMGTTVDFNESNPFFVMKSVGYIKLPTTEDKEGLVRIIVNKPENEIKTLKTSICNTLRQIIHDPNITPVIDSTHGIIETKLSEIRFYLLDINKNRISTRQVVAFFSTSDMTMKLRNMGVQELHPCLRPSDNSIKAYLEKTPDGFDPNVWTQAVRNNPNPQEMIPVPILGFQALKARVLAQKSQTEQHESRLKLIGNEIATLQQTQTSIVSKYEQAKRKQFELNHRLLKIMVQQETTRKSGHSIQEDEEILRINFETILNELTSPSGVKSELTEMTSMMRLTLPSTQYRENNYKLGEDVTIGIQMHLSDQQERIENLMKVITEDMEDLSVIQEALVDGRM